MFGLIGAGISMQFAATAKLAKWLHHNHREVWRELGCPGTTFFKGDPGNGYLRRTSALQRMQRLMPLHAYRRQLNNGEAERYLQQHRLGGRLAVIFMLLFGAGIFYGVARDKSRSQIPLINPTIIQEGEQAAPSNCDKPSN